MSAATRASILFALCSINALMALRLHNQGRNRQSAFHAFTSVFAGVVGIALLVGA